MKNSLLANNSHKISFLILSENLIGKMFQNLSSAAVVVGTLRVSLEQTENVFILIFLKVNQ